MSALVLDAGALIAIDHGDHAMHARLERAAREGEEVRTNELLGKTGTRDAIDASVALLAEAGDRVLTSDPDDLRGLCGGAGNTAVVIGC